MQKENEWKEKMCAEEQKFNKHVEQLKAEIKQSLNDKQLISKTYESQLKMMSEHLVELQM
eukprot:CAMPEP_0168610172 /NCGR_PEP_ID=MMETSP0449_2-20121227/1639_1 /TAXON_ID=1082188 /ORGANISM="Strombidium rassoulzadegani, Strain ras09" /LENGTH=59 /DNA_ID=CAMNT_0008650447 /DNA_START=422 /DNA_END=601 /DNA_ORIENTATION=-